MVVTMTLDEVLGAGAAGKKLPQSLDDKLASESDAIQKQSIEFERASRPFSTISDDLKRKYTVLRPTVAFGKSRASSAPSTSHFDSPSTSQSSNDSADSLDAADAEVASRFGQPQNDGVPDPKFFIDTKPVLIEWPKGWTQTKSAVGAGLGNYGNTCFLNSVLQVLTHTAPLVRFALEQHSTAECRAISQGFCAICSFQAHVDRVFKRNAYGPANPVIPKWVLSHMRSRIMKSYVSGRQEDAHEFLRFFMEALEASRLVEYKGQKLDGFTKETNMISRIFGGFTRNTITCHVCSEKSSTFDPFLDLSLDIGTRPAMFSHAIGSAISSVEEALKHFTKIEELSGSNAYKCLKCKRSVKAFKRMQIHRAPQVLTIHLKRFDHTGKISKHISYKDKLDLTPYMSQETTAERALYQLYGVIVHTGNTTHSGHYVAYVRNMNNQWYIADDSRVQTINEQQTKSAQAYMLFYQRSSPPKAEVRPQTHLPPFVKNSAGAAMIGPHMPPTPPPTPGKVTHSVSPFTPSSVARKSLSNGERLKPLVKANLNATKATAAHPPTSLVPYDDDDESSPSESPKLGERSTASSSKQSSKASTPTNIFERIKEEAPSISSPVALLTDEKRPPIRIKINRKLLSGNQLDATPVKPLADFAASDDRDEEELKEAKKRKKEKKEKREKKKHKKEKKKKRRRKDSEDGECGNERKRKGEPRDDDSDGEPKRRRLDSDSDSRPDHHLQSSSSSHRPPSHSANHHQPPCNGDSSPVEALQANGGRGYGGLVHSWSTDKVSKVEQPLPVERSRSADTDSYDEEVIEERRLKKFKSLERRRSDTGRHSNGKHGDRRNGNDFQRFYENRNNPQDKHKRWSHGSHNRPRPNFDDDRRRSYTNGFSRGGNGGGSNGHRYSNGERRYY